MLVCRGLVGEEVGDLGAGSQRERRSGLRPIRKYHADRVLVEKHYQPSDHVWTLAMSDAYIPSTHTSGAPNSGAPLVVRYRAPKFGAPLVYECAPRPTLSQLTSGTLI